MDELAEVSSADRRDEEKERVVRDGIADYFPFAAMRT